MIRRTLQALDPARLYIAPSLLSADFARMGDEVRACAAAGADVLHIDVMDGHFVPNLAIGPDLVRAIRPLTDLPFDVHLMLSHPARYLESFRAAGADHITIHIECEDEVPATIAAIRRLGCSAGLTLKPGTPVSALAPYLTLVDLVLVMTVEPGFSGQAFRVDAVPKLAELRRLATAAGHRLHLEVDGGVSAATAPQCVRAGANILAAASALFKAPAGLAAAIAGLRASAAA